MLWPVGVEKVTGIGKRSSSRNVVKEAIPAMLCWITILGGVVITSWPR